VATSNETGRLAGGRISYGMQELVAMTDAWEAGARSAEKRLQEAINH
jgi:hypothetical protein